MFLWKLAWRNVWRQKRRTALLVVVVAYASLSTIFLWGMTEGQTESILSNQARFILAPAIVMNPAYKDDPDPENALGSLDFIPQLSEISGVDAAAPRLELFGLLRSPYTSETVPVRGVDPELESRVSKLPQTIHEGRMLAQTGEIVLGHKLAAELDVRLGERVVVDSSALAGPQALGLRLVGLVDSNIADLDLRTALIHIDDARELSGVATATGVALDIARGQENTIAAQVNEVFAQDTGLETFGLSALLGALTQEVEAGYLQMIPIVILFAIFAALAVTSTVVVSVIERSKEFGMMAAIGLVQHKLSRLIVIEAVIATGLGWLVGLAIGYTLTYIFSINNIMGPLIAGMSESFADFGFGDEMYTAVKPIYALYAAVTVMFAAIFALIFPAARVRRIVPAQAMRTN